MSGLLYIETKPHVTTEYPQEALSEQLLKNSKGKIKTQD